MTVRNWNKAATVLVQGGKVLTTVLAAATLLSGPALAQDGQPAAADAKAQAVPIHPTYVLGPNDGVLVVVYGQEEFNVSTRVKSDGSIVMPLIGRVVAEGKTAISLAEDIEQRLVSGNYLRTPIVNVEVTEYNSRYVRVVGKVGSPGLVPLERSRHLLDVLLRSGWVRAEGSQYITIRRAADDAELKIDSDKLARGEAEEVLLSPGDTIYVAEAELVYLTGAVARPGPYALKPGMKIADLIAQAGGVGATGSSGKYGLKRGDADETRVDDQTELEPGDVVRVRERLF